MNTFPCKEMMVQPENFVSLHGILAVPAIDNTIQDDCQLFKVSPKHDSDLAKSTYTSLLFRAEWLQQLVQETHIDTIDTTPEQITIHESFNELPSVTIFPKALQDLESTVYQDQSIVLLGNNGSGKTHSALIVAAMSHYMTDRQMTYLDCRAVKSIGRLVSIMEAIQEAIEEARDRNNLLILDDLDELVTESHVAVTQGSGAQVQQPNWTEMEQSKLICDHIRQLLDDVTTRPPVIITCNSAEIVHSVFPPDVHPTMVHLPLLDSAEKLDLVLQRVEWESGSHQTWTVEQLRHGCTSLDLEGTSRSFLPLDLCTFSSRLAKGLNQNSEDPSIVRQVIQEILESFVPISRDAASLESVKCNTTWDDVGGLDKAKEELLDTVVRPSLYRRIYEKSSVRLPRGILLFGPTGCGKSHLVPALASRSNLPLVMCRGPELLDRYIGGSEAKVRDLFSRAFLAAPCILFLDEFDALAPKRGSDSTGVTDRVVNQLLTFLDGVEDMSASNTVYIVAATSRPDKIDPALLRPGRLEKHIYIGLPENRQEMIDTIQKIAKRYDVTQKVLDSFCAAYDFAAAGVLSPADVRAGFQTAHILAVRDHFRENSSMSTPTSNTCIEESYLQQGFSQVRRSLSTTDLVYYTNMRDRFQRKRPTNSQHTSDDQSAMHPLRTALK
jgi:peroxin-1